MKTIRILFISIISLALVGAAGYYGFASSAPAAPTAPPAPKTVDVTKCDVSQTVSAPGLLVNTSETSVKMPVNGKLARVLVKPGDVVSAGQPLAELDAVTISEAQVRLLEAKQALETAQTARTAMDYPRATPEYLAKLTKEIKAARENVAMMADLFKNSDDPAVKAQALTNLSAAQQKKDELIATYNWYTGKASQVDKENASTRLTLAQAQVDAAQAVLQSLEITAPFAGTILEVSAVSGQSFAADAGLFKLTDPQALEVRASITEEDYPLLSKGMQAELYFDARPDVVVRGRVERIVPRRIEGDRPLYNIYISLSQVPAGLADGMTADSAVTIASRAGVLCLPRAVVRASGDGKAALKIWNGLQTEDRAITVGLRGDAFVEILSGLKEGDKVVTR